MTCFSFNNDWLHVKDDHTSASRRLGRECKWSPNQRQRLFSNLVVLERYLLSNFEVVNRQNERLTHRNLGVVGKPCDQHQTLLTDIAGIVRLHRNYWWVLL